jgi:hypothetical protein
LSVLYGGSKIFEPTYADMKNTLAVVVLCLPLAASAQIEKGRSFLSGSFNFSESGSKNKNLNVDAKTFQLNTSVSYAYLFAHRWAVGVTPSFQLQKYNVYGDNHVRKFGVGPFVRRYFSVNEKLLFHLDAGMNAIFGQSWIVNGGDKSPKTTGTDLNFYFAPGASYFVTEKIALVATLGRIEYASSKTKDSEWRTWNFDANFGLSSITFGAAFYF